MSSCRAGTHPVRIVPEVIEQESLLRAWGVTREQMVDLALLVGTDFNEGIKGIRPKTAPSRCRRALKASAGQGDKRRGCPCLVLTHIRRPAPDLHQT
jgi:hypothetical protein